MAKWVDDDVFDAALEYVANNGGQLDVVSDTTTPTNLTNSLASVSLTTGIADNDYTLEAGENGRKLTVAEQTGVDITAEGTARHVVISDGTNPIVVTTCTEQYLYAGNTINIPAFSQEIAYPT